MWCTVTTAYCAVIFNKYLFKLIWELMEMVHLCIYHKKLESMGLPTSKLKGVPKDVFVWLLISTTSILSFFWCSL